VAVAARRECVRQLQGKGLSERQACRLVGISTSVLRYQPGDDGNQPLRERLKELAVVKNHKSNTAICKRHILTQANGY